MSPINLLIRWNLGFERTSKRHERLRSSPFGMMRELGLLGPCGFAGKGEKKTQVPDGVRKRINVKVR